MKDLILLSNEVVIRYATKDDCENLLRLMKKLAVFEGYINNFKVTKNDLIEYGFSKNPQFTSIVAESNNKNVKSLQGYVVYYIIPFTYDLKPTLFIKELYVEESSRGNSTGKKLMKAAIEDAKKQGCGCIKWDVLSDNINAQSFYKSFGAINDSRWQGYVLKV